MPDLSTGSTFAGHRIEEVAGYGGMGVVYRATHLALNREVALKVIAPELSSDPIFRERFKQESQTAALLHHPNVIPIYHAGEEQGELYITMRFVVGADLRGLVAQGGALDAQTAADLVSQVGAALDAAHARGLVHRDVKPANVLIESSEGGPHAFLTDFGLTKRELSAGGLTKTGVFVGTLDYIAPEQLRGDPVDARADVYALGCVLFHSLTGKVPFPRESEPAKIWAHIGEPPPSVTEAAPTVPAPFEEVVRRALAKHPAERYPSAGDLGRAAMAAAEQRVSMAPERTVAVGQAAPTTAGAVPSTGAGTAASPTAPATGPPATVGSPPPPPPPGPPPQAPPTPAPQATPPPVGYQAPPGAGYAAAPAPPAARRRSQTPLIIGGAALVAVLLVSAVVALTLGGGDGSDGAKPGLASPTIPLRESWTSFDFGEGALWTADDERSLTRHDLESGGLTDTFRLPKNAEVTDLEAGEGFVWADTFDREITKVDPESGTTSQVSNLAEDEADKRRVLQAGEGALWLLNPLKSTLTKVDPATGRPETPVAMGTGVVDMDVGGGFVYVTRADDTVTFVDPATSAIVDRKRYPDTGGPVVFDGGSLFLGATPGKVLRVDVASRESANLIKLGRGGSVTNFDAGIGSVWVAYKGDRQIKRIDPNTGRRIGEPYRLTEKPENVIVGEGKVWVRFGTGDNQRMTRLEP